MANLATSLLDFILDLLSDPETAADFKADPQGTLDTAGLSDLCPADIQNARLVLDEMPPAGVTNASLTTAATPAAVAGTTAPVLVTTTDVSPAEAPESDSVIEQLKYIQQTFTYNSETTIDVRDSVWAGKDVYQIFGDDAVLATGDGIAAGDDVDDVTIDRSVEIEDSFNIDDSFNPENTEVDGDGNAVGRGNDVDNTDNSIEADGTGAVVGDDNETGDAVSGNGNVVGNELDVEDSFNDNSTTNTSTTTNTDNSSDDDGSYNDTNTEIDNSSDDDVDVDVEFDDAVLGNNSAGDTVDQSTTDSGNTDIEDSGNGNALAFDNAIAVTTEDIDVDV